MADSIKCPKCDSALTAQSKFCDQCGAALGAPVVAGKQAGEPAVKASGFNWLGLVLVVAVLGAAWWLLFGPQKEAPVTPMGGGDMAGAHGGTSSTANPHGGSGSAMANPHGGDTGGMPASGGMGADGDAHGDGSMDGLMESMETAKAALEADSLDVESLQILYQSYGMIGRSSELRPRLEEALAELGRRLEADEAVEGLSDTGKNVAIAAVLGGDPEGAVLVIEGLKVLWPADKDFDAMIGDVYCSADLLDEGITAYDTYLANEVAVDGMYWAVRIKRANAFALKHSNAGEAGDQASLETAISELQAVTLENAGDYQGWYSLGRVLQQAGQQDKAISSWRKAQECTEDGMERWAAESEIAKAEGREAPAPPETSSPH